MRSAIRPHDVVAGFGVSLWILGMAFVLAVEDAGLQIAGGVLWAAGLLIATVAGVAVYLRRDPYGE